MITTYDGKTYRRRASHQTVWELASKQERERLIALPRLDLLTVLKTSGITDLTEADQAIVLDHLYPADAQHASPTATPSVAGRRKPAPLTGKGLPFGPRAVPNHRRRLVIALAIMGPTAWMIIIMLGYALAQGGRG